jgi:hypothetical protein
MIFGMHTILYSKKADAVRAFFRDVLKFPSVDAGHGWLIFAAPPSELAVHPVEGPGYAELYLLCEDLESTVKFLQKKGVEFPSPISDQRWAASPTSFFPTAKRSASTNPATPWQLAGRPQKSPPPSTSAQKARSPRYESCRNIAEHRNVPRVALTPYHPNVSLAIAPIACAPST